MLINITHVSDSTRFKFRVKPQTLFRNTPSFRSRLQTIPACLKEKQGSLSLTLMHKNRRTHVMAFNGVEPGIPPSGPPLNALSWTAAVAIGVMIPFIGYKWGPTIKNKVDTVIKRTEDVVEAVEKVAGKVEEVAEDILDDLPAGGKVREAVEFVEKVAEMTRKDAGAVDDFIDKVQEEEEMAESMMTSSSLRDECKIPLEDNDIKLEDSKQNNNNN